MKGSVGRGLAAVALAIVLVATPGDAAETAGGSWKVLGWNDLGMHCMDDSYEVFAILPPFNTIHAQVIDPQGNLVTSQQGITVSYEAVADPSGSINTSSAGKTNFWQFVTDLFGASPPVDQGLTGSQMPGAGNTPQSMQWEGGFQWYTGEGIPLTPYDDSGSKNYYPLMRLTARDGSGAVLATSDIVLPVSDEMSCRTCHASGSPPAGEPGGWVWDPDPVRDYRLNVLLKHDDLQLGDPTYQNALAAAGYSASGLYDTVTTDQTAVLCARCHGSNALPGTGLSGISPLTQAVHAFHSSVTDPVTGMALEASANRTACYRCHPGSETRCLRGAMGHATAADASLSIQCQSCHGTMSMVGSPSRQGWFDEPTCQSCHTGTADNNAGQIRYLSSFDTPGHVRQAPSTVFATNPDTPAPGVSLFRFSTGHGDLQCEACHGSTHAIFPSSHANDDIRNVQLQGHGGTVAECSACHGSQPQTVNQGPHGMHPVGQQWIEDHKDAAEGGGGGEDRPALAEGSAAQCQACHGTDYRGTVLSRALGTRTVSAFGSKTFWKGYQIGCYTCHSGPDNDHENPNRKPVVNDLTATTPAAQAVTLTLQASDGDGDPLTLRTVSQPAHGRAGVAGTTATYVPDPGFAGTDTFTYAAWDGMADSNLATVTVTVTGTSCTLACTASAPSSANVGDQVPFTADAVPSGCSGTPAYQWSFGDGATSNAQNPQHAYASEGTYTWSVTATLNGVSCSRSGSITINPVGGGCTLTCSASAPATAAVGETVRFDSTVTSSGECQGSPAYSWEFGDGGVPAAADPSHSYLAPGVYSWSVTVLQDGATCSSTGSIAVTAEPPDTVGSMLVASHAEGADDSTWRTDVAVLNPWSQSVNIDLAFPSHNGRTTRSATLAPGRLREWVDVVGGLFGIRDNVSGALTVEAPQALVVTSRTYNDAGGGTFGQFFPAVSFSQAVTFGRTGFLNQIRKNHDFRTNVGFLNLGDAVAQVRVTLYSPDGSPIGNAVTRTVDAGGWLQIDDVFGKADAGNRDLARASVQVLTPGGTVWAYASVIDRRTGDPVTVPVALPVQ